MLETSQADWGSQYWHQSYWAKRKNCGRTLSEHFGVRTYRPTPSRWMGTKGPAELWPQMLGTRYSQELPATIVPKASPPSSLPKARLAAGEFGPCQQENAVTTLCLIIMDRYGHMTTR